MSNLVEILSAPAVWVQPTGEMFEQAKALFLSHEVNETTDLKLQEDDSDESPF